MSDAIACRECGTAIPRPKRNQSCCSRECRFAWRDRQRANRRQAPGLATRPCRWCDGQFRPQRQTQEYCGRPCRRAEEAIAAKHALALFRSGEAVRYNGRKAPRNVLWHAIRMMRLDAEDGRAKARLEREAREGGASHQGQPRPAKPATEPNGAGKHFSGQRRPLAGRETGTTPTMETSPCPSITP